MIGPDEYHEPVDDNAFTNVMARWNLRRAAELRGIDPRERAEWRALADTLVDGYDPRTGIYEQFAGFHGLEPLVIAELARGARSRPTCCSAGRVAGAQVLKQADVLMLHHLVPTRSHRARAAEPGLLRAPNGSRQLALAGDPRGPPRARVVRTTRSSRSSWPRGSTSTT